MRLFSADDDMIFFLFLATKNWKNQPQKKLRTTLFFWPIVAQNVAYRETVNRTGAVSVLQSQG